MANNSHSNAAPAPRVKRPSVSTPQNKQRDTVKSAVFEKDLLVDIFGSRARVAIFRLLFDEYAQELCITEIVEKSGMAEQGVDQQLRLLANMKLLISRIDRNRRYYRADVHHPLFPCLRGIVMASPVTSATSDRLE